MNSITLEIKLLRPDARMPAYATPGSAALDLHACLEGPVEIGPRDLAVIPTDGGPVMHMMRPASPLFGEIGEVYFSEVEPGCVKAWKCHTRQTQRFAVPVGQLKIVLYDNRPESPTRGRIMEVLLGRPDNYALLQIPPRVWYGFTAAGSVPAVICNCPDFPHDPAEGLRKDVDSRDIPYHW